jgi:hypothetical protein
MLLEPYPPGTVTSTHKTTFETTGKPPYSQPYHTSPNDRIIIRKLIDESIRQKRFQLSNSPYASHTCIVKMEGGHRLVCNFRLVNKILVLHRFPMARIDDVLTNFDEMRYSRFFRYVECFLSNWSSYRSRQALISFHH